MKTFYQESLEKIGSLASEYGEKITLYGFKGVHVSGHKGLLDFSSETVLIKTHKKKIKIFGENLFIKEISADELYVCGNIFGVERER